MSLHQLLIVHPVPSMRSLMTSMLRTMGHKIEEALGEESALAQLDKSRADLLLVSSDAAEGLDPIHLLAQVRGKYPKLPVLMFTSEPRPDRAREVMLRGATSVLRFPMPANQLRAVVSQALEDVVPANLSRVKEPEVGTNGSLNRDPKISAHGPGGPASSRPTARDSVVPMVGEDPALRLAVELTDAVAMTRAPVLIQGERGSGKSQLARRLHALGPRPNGPFLEVGCAASRDHSLEADLFGRTVGSGRSARDGLIAEARGGTLVLDSVGELSPELQLRLVELLSEEASSPAGELKESAGCRIVATSREDLGMLVEEGRFRADLYRALAMVSLCLPPLKKRRGDIAVLAEHFRDLFACRHVKTNRGFSAESLLYLKDHPWPGNVAELRDAVERAVLVSRDSRIMPSHLALTPVSSSASHGSHGSNGVAAGARRSRSRPSPDGEILPLKEALEEPERQLILAALEALNWNRQETARVLDINRTTLYKKMKKYGLIFDEPVWVN